MKWVILIGVALILTPFVFGAVFFSSPVETGNLIESYALQNGNAIIIVQRLDQLAVVYVHDGTRDDLEHINFSGELGNTITEICGGRLHLTYVLDGEIWHETVDVPNANLGFLPIVCKE